MKSNSVHLLWIALVAMTLAQPQFTSAAPGDEHWSTEFGWPGTSVVVHAAVTHNERLYIGGEGDTTNTAINVWDGTQWSALGTFLGNSPVVYDLAWVGETLYAAGFFTNVNGAPIKGLARWNGNTWTDIGFAGNAYALAVDGGDLYVGGSFTNIASLAVTNIARWNGSTWSTLGAGVGKSGNFILSLLINNGLLYAGGSFTNSGSVATTNVAQWNGSIWTNLGNGVGGPPSSFDRAYTLAAVNDSIYAGGIFGTAGTVAASGVARWDGTNWSALGSGIAGTPLSLVNFGGLLCAAGGFNSAGGISATNFAIWNGSSWTAAGKGFSSVAYRALATATNIYIGGNFTFAGDLIAYHIASWNGTEWNPVGPIDKSGGVSSTVRAILGQRTNLFAGGDFALAGQTNATRVGHYDGTNWSVLGTGLNNTVSSLALVGTNLYAGGTFTGGAGGPFAYHLARWNGANWISLNGISFATVNALATRSNDLFVAGYFTISASDGTAAWLTRWDGTNAWSVLHYDENTFWSSPLDGIGLTAIAIQETNIYLSGHFSIGSCDPTLTDCTNCLNVMRFDGTYGRVMSTGLNSNANAIAVMDTNVYFAGPFTNAGGVAVSGIARWDGNSWSDVGGGVVGRGVINKLAVSGTNLFASGTFTNLGGVAAARVARWNGTSWSPLGSSTRFGASAGNVQALCATPDDVFVGGTFTSAGGKPSYSIARWNEGVNFDAGSIWLSKPAVQPGAPFRFTVTAVSVPTYVVDVSTNLTLWTPVRTNTLTPYDFTESEPATQPKHFYRVRSLP